MDDAAEAAKVIGPRLRQLREGRGLTLRDLAARTGLSKNTILRLESGLPVTEPILERICNSLQTILPNLLAAATPPDGSIARVSRQDDSDWRIAFCTKKAPKTLKDFMQVDQQSERERIGHLGFVSGFVQALSGIEGGRLQAALVDVYGPQERAGFRHSGEEFVYCLRGRLRLTLGKEVHVLGAGDSVVFPSGIRHRYESANESAADDPVKIIMVWMEADEVAESVSHDEECDLE